MKIGKLWFSALLAIGALPASALAQPSVSADAVVTMGDTYDTTAPGVPVESVDVFYDQLAPFGVWVDEPTIGHVFIPAQEDFVPYTNGHWEDTSVGFVWVAYEPFAAQTSHYGRWAYSSPYARWVWLPDTQWGPSWVDWRQSGNDFGWAPLAPDIIIKTGYSAPIESWHYCGATHVLDIDIAHYYEPRERVVEIHRAARPMANYAMVSNVRVVVGPSAQTLRTLHVTAKPVKIDARLAGRVASTSEAHAQVVHAQSVRALHETANQTRIAAAPKIHAVAAKQPAPATRVEPKAQPVPVQHEAPKAEPQRAEPQHAEPKPAAKPAPVQHAEPKQEPKPEPKQASKPEPKPAEPKPAETKKPEPENHR